MDSSCSIYLFLFCMDNTKIYVIYELEMFVWFVLYYAMDLEFGFVDFYTFIMVTVELGVYIICLCYAIFLF